MRRSPNGRGPSSPKAADLGLLQKRGGGVSEKVSRCFPVAFLPKPWKESSMSSGSFFKPSFGSAPVQRLNFRKGFQSGQAEVTSLMQGFLVQPRTQAQCSMRYRASRKRREVIFYSCPVVSIQERVVRSSAAQVYKENQMSSQW